MSENNQETNQRPQSEGGNNQTPPPVQTPPPAQTPPPTSTYTSMFDQPIDYGDTPPARPANNMVMAIVASVLNIFACCGFYIGVVGIIVGIVAIVFSTQVNSKYDSRDYDGAMESAKKAKMLSMISLGIAVVGIIIAIIALIFLGGSESFMNKFNRQM